MQPFYILQLSFFVSFICRVVLVQSLSSELVQFELDPPSAVDARVAHVAAIVVGAGALDHVARGEPVVVAPQVDVLSARARVQSVPDHLRATKMPSFQSINSNRQQAIPPCTVT